MRIEADTVEELEVVAGLRRDWLLYGEVHATNAGSGLSRLDPTRVAYRDEGPESRLAARAEAAAAEAAELRALFDLQWTRVREATAAWQAEDPAARDLTWPDLARLVEWLMDRAGLPRSR